MSFLRRIFRRESAEVQAQFYRQETAKRLWDTSTDRTEPLTFTDDLVTNNMWEREQKQHLREVAFKDPIAYYICVKISENVFDDWFKFVDPTTGEEIMLEAQEELKRMNAKFWLTQALIAERIYGHSWLLTAPNKYRTDYSSTAPALASLDVFTPMNAEFSDFDDMGNPTYVRVWPNPSNKAFFEDVSFENFIFFCTRPRGRAWEGYSALYPVWTDLTYIRSAKHALGWANQKFGIGLFLWKLRGRLTDETASALENMLKDISLMRAALIDGTLVEDVQFLGPSGTMTTNIAEAVDMHLGLISAGSGIPKDILTGVSAGAITGSEINNKALYATLSQIQQSVEPYIRELVRRMGFTDDYEISWNTRYATDELEQAQIRLLNAQAEQLEMQTAQGLREGDIRILTGEETQRTRNPAGVQS